MQNLLKEFFLNFCLVSVIHKKTIITLDDKSCWLNTFYWVVKNKRNFCRAGFAFGKTKWSSITQEIEFFKNFHSLFFFGLFYYDFLSLFLTFLSFHLSSVSIHRLYCTFSICASVLFITLCFFVFLSPFSHFCGDCADAK